MESTFHTDEKFKSHREAYAVLANCPVEHRGDHDMRVPGHGQRMVCRPCYKRFRDLWNEAEARRKEAARAAGRAYWRRRGIAVGETVYTNGSGLLGPTKIAGRAKVGVNGPYVTCQHWQTRGRQLVPDHWHKAA